METDTTPNNQRTFPLAAIIGVTSGRMVSRGGVHEICELLEWFVDEPDPISTHQIPRISNLCEPRLLEQHPKLAELPEFPAMPKDATREAKQIVCDEWVAACAEIVGGSELVLTKLDAEDYTHVPLMAEPILDGKEVHAISVADLNPDW